MPLKSALSAFEPSDLRSDARPIVVKSLLTQWEANPLDSRSAAGRGPPDRHCETRRATLRTKI